MKISNYILSALILLFTIETNAQMVLEYNIASSRTQIALPLAGTVNVSIDWGDGSAIETVTFATIKPHVYSTSGTKTVTITGTMTAYGSSNIGSGNARLTKVISWDGLGITSFEAAFYNAEMLTQVPDALPANVTNLSYMFENATVFNQPIGSWNTSTVHYMSGMFKNATAFNQPIGSWNTDKVYYMDNMFSGATAFNQPIGSWNTGAVSVMNSMFHKASSFNQPIGSWNIAKVNTISAMFSGATAFNQPIGSWNTAQIVDFTAMFSGATAFNQPIGTWNTTSAKAMGSMFLGATAFNQPLESWNTNSVTMMYYMFSGATAFNQPLGSWKIAIVTNMANMFENTALCTENYDNLLNGWAPQGVQRNVQFNGGNSKYSSESADARAMLINKAWTITDAGLGTSEDAKCTFTSLNDEYNQTLATVLYPNPVKDRLTINFHSPKNELFTYSVFSTTGLLVVEKEMQSNGLSTEIELAELHQGNFIIRIKTKEDVILYSFVKE